LGNDLEVGRNTFTAFQPRIISAPNQEPEKGLSSKDTFACQDGIVDFKYSEGGARTGDGGSEAV